MPLPADWNPKYPITLPFPASIVGERVVVRPYVDGDAEALRAAVDASRERLRPWMPWAETHRHLAETRAFIAITQAELLLRRNVVLGIFDPLSGALVGGTGLHPPGGAPIDWALRCFEIGYWARTGAEGRGLVTDAVRALATAAFRDLDAQRLEIRCDERNARSWRVAERAGFTLEATRRHDALDVQGRPRVTRVYARLPHDPA
jgi:RimJ/RimL family protein N-acetyltransferase